MKIQHKRAAAAGCTIAIGIFLSWLGGYNFDQRNHDVVANAVLILAVAGFAAAFPFSED
jgi:hypothetical protein